MAIPEGMARRVSLAVGVKRIVYFPTVWALGYLTVPPEKMPMLLFVVSLLTILHVHTYSTPTSHAKGRSMYSPLVLASVPPVMYFDMSPPLWTTWKPVGSNFGFGHRLILCILVSLHAFEHILGDQFHGRVELTGQDCDLLGESADLRGKLVDDLVRVGWNLSQNKSPFNAKPPQSDWIAGVEKNGEKRGQSAAVIVSIRVTAFNSSKVRVRPRFVFTSVNVTDVPESSNVASTPR